MAEPRIELWMKWSEEVGKVKEVGGEAEVQDSGPSFASLPYPDLSRIDSYIALALWRVAETLNLLLADLLMTSNG